MTPNFDIREESQLEGWSGFSVCLVHPPESHEQMIHQSEFFKISFFIYSTGERGVMRKSGTGWGKENE